MSIFPVGLDLPPPIRPITFLSAARKLCSRSCHCVSSSVRWTRTRVFTPRLAITAAAVTVLPKAAGVVLQCRPHRALLVVAQRASEAHVDLRALEALVLDNGTDAVGGQQGDRVVQATARHCDVVGGVLCGTHDPPLF